MPNSSSMTQATMGEVQIPVSSRRLPGRCRECRRVVSAAPASAPMAGPSDVLRAARPRQKPRSELTTQRPSNVEPRVDGPTHRLCALPSSALLPAIAWQLGKLRLALLVRASGSTVCRFSGVSTGFAEPWHLLRGVCQMYPILCPVNYARTYSLKKLDYGICVVRAAFTPVGAGRAAVRVTA